MVRFGSDLNFACIVCRGPPFGIFGRVVHIICMSSQVAIGVPVTEVLACITIWPCDRENHRIAIDCSPHFTPAPIPHCITGECSGPVGVEGAEAHINCYCDIVFRCPARSALTDHPVKIAWVEHQYHMCLP